MNLVISGENQKNLAKIEALARELGLNVTRELAHVSDNAGRGLRRVPGRKDVETANSGIGEEREGKPSSGKVGPLYGSE